jgi:hypothetical protein
MARETIELPEGDAVEITTITNNALDVLMADAPVARRWPLEPDVFGGPFPIAKHGYSVPIRVRAGARRGTVLFDTGVSRRGIL